MSAPGWTVSIRCDRVIFHRLADSVTRQNPHQRLTLTGAQPGSPNLWAPELASILRWVPWYTPEVVRRTCSVHSAPPPPQWLSTHPPRINPATPSTFGQKFCGHIAWSNQIPLLAARNTLPPKTPAGSVESRPGQSPGLTIITLNCP
jgi:hypothetical protein